MGHVAHDEAPPGTFEHADKNMEASRNAWRAYALELEWKLDEMMRDRILPQMDGQRLVRVK